MFAAVKIARRWKPDVISAHTTKAGALAAGVHFATGLPATYAPHGWSFADGVPLAQARIRAALERLWAPSFARIIDVCAADKELALRFRVGSPQQHIVIHNGVHDVPRALRANPANPGCRLVTVARFEPQKDYGTLLRSLNMLKHHTWELDVVGIGRMESQVRQAARDLGIASRIRFLGELDDVSTVLRDASVFVLCSRWEGFPRSVIEAMRAGLPVISSSVGGVNEAVEDGCNGWTIPGQAVDTWADRLAQLMSAPKLRSRMGAESRRRFEARFSFASMIARWEVVLTTAAATR